MSRIGGASAPRDVPGGCSGCSLSTNHGRPLWTSMAPNVYAAPPRIAASRPAEVRHLQRPHTDSGRFAKQAVIESGVPHTTPHDLRHTTASLTVSAGANVKAVQRMLRHARGRAG